MSLQKQVNEEGGYSYPFLASIGKWLFAGVALLLFAMYYTNIFSAVTNQDPSLTYIPMARELLHRPLNGETFRMLTQWYAPGYTLLLALVIRLFGELAALWVNPVLAILLGVLWVKLAAKLSRQKLVGYMALSLAVFFFLRGDYANGYHLLYPFRDLPCLAFMILGCYGFLKSSEEHTQPWYSWLACLAGGLAILIREPSAIGFVPGLLWWFFDVKRKHLRPGTQWFLFGVSVVLGIMFIAYIGLLSTHRGSQVEQWMYFLKTKTWLDIYLHAQLQLACLHSAIGWLGWIGVAIGVVLLRRNRPAICFIILPAFLFFIFYLPYTPHRRYMIKILLYLSFPVAISIDWLVHWIAHRVPRYKDAVRYSLGCGVVLLLGVFTGLHVHAATPWGKRISLEHIQSLNTQLAPYSTNRFIAICDSRDRHLSGAMHCFSRVIFNRNHDFVRALAEGVPIYYFEPLDSVNKTRLHKDFFTLSATGLAEEAGQFVPVLEPAGVAPAKIDFAGAEYTLHKLQPWPTNRQAKSINIHTSKDRIIWINLKSSNLAAEKVLTVRNAAAEEIWRWPAFTGNGFKGFYLPGTAHQGGWHEFSLTSSDRIPPEVFYANEPDDSFVWFSLGQDRESAVGEFFDKPFRKYRRKKLWMVELFDQGLVLLPTIQGLQAETWTMGLKLSSLHASGQEVTIQYGQGNEIWASHPFIYNKMDQYHYIHIPVAQTEQEGTMQCWVTPYHGPKNPIRLEQLRIRASPVNP